MSAALLIHGEGANGSTTLRNAAIFDDLADIENLGVTISTTQSKFGGSSLYFSGSPNRFSILTPYLPAGDYTIEFWTYCTYATCVLFSNVYGSYYYPSNYYWVNGSAIISVPNITQNGWQHIAISRVSGNIRVFNDGIQVGSTYAYANPVDLRSLNFGRYVGGGNDNLYYRGYMDEIRISTDEGFYAANFTPPTSAFVYRRFYSLIKYGLVSPLAYYGLDELSGSVLEDYQATYPLTLSGSVTFNTPTLFTKGDFSAIAFDNASASGATANLNGIKEFSIGFFIKTDTASQTVVSKSGVFSVSLSSTGEIEWTVNSTSITGSVSVTDNFSHYIVCGYREGGLSLTIDGQLDVYNLPQGLTVTDAGTQPLVVGPFTGTLDELYLIPRWAHPFASYLHYVLSNGINLAHVWLISNSDYACPGAPPGNPLTQLYKSLESRNLLDCIYQVNTTYNPTIYVRTDFVPISGYVTVEATPASRQLWLMEWYNKQVVRTTWSDSVTGFYQFLDVKAGHYFVWSEDYLNVFKPQSTAEIQT